MKLLVNCDQVFDVLTRGPFPTGDASDDAVEFHLAACHDCRQLAEALRPAVSLLHEAVARDQAWNLPGYQGSLPPMASRPARSGAAPATAAARPHRAQSRLAPRRAAEFGRWIDGLRMVAASVLIVALGTLAWGLMMSARFAGSGSPASRIAAQPMSPGAQPDVRGRITLASLKLPAACLPTGSLAGSSAIRCCTHCHAAGQPVAEVRVAANVRYTQSCSICHRS